MITTKLYATQTAIVLAALCTQVAISNAQSPSATPSSAATTVVSATIHPEDRTPSADAADLDRFVQERIGEPQLVEVTPDVFVAVGFDMSNVVVIRTSEGNVIIDTGSCTPRARQIRDAVKAAAPGATRAVVYTHGDIEQTGGGAVWVDEPDTAIWGSRKLSEQFLRQCILLQPAELRRGVRQFTMFVANEGRVPSALGKLPEMEHLGGLPDIRLPNHLVDDEATFDVGGVEFQLFAAPGASADQICVWIPSKRVILAGDNFMRGFPELSSVRGNPNRNADEWIISLDKMRALNPEFLIGARHLPVSGEKEVQTALVAYRDSIQWLRDETVRGINRGDSVDQLAATIRLPEHLAASPYLSELTSTVAGAVRSIFCQYAGWFDEQAENLRPLPPDETAQREIAMMGGAKAVLDTAVEARDKGETQWSVHLLTKLRRAHPADANDGSAVAMADVDRELASSLEALSAETGESNARGYLLSAATELRAPNPKLDRWPCPSDETIRQIPMSTIFELMALRLKPGKANDADDVVWINLRDEQKQYIVSVRRGILEVVEDTPLPGTPQPGAVITTDGLTWRRLCMGVVAPMVEVISGRVDVKGSRQTLKRFVDYFECCRDFEKRSASQTKLTASERAKAVAEN